MFKRRFTASVVLGLLLFTFFAAARNNVYASSEDFHIDGTYEAAIDLPRILFLLKRSADGPALEYEGSFEVNYAFLDTGASGMLMSRETSEALGIALEPGALFVDAGVGGDEFFYVSEPLYVGSADFMLLNPYDQNAYSLAGPWRLQITQQYADWLVGPIDILGMPTMVDKVVVLDSGATNNLEYFSADIKQPGDPSIPDIDIHIALRFENFISPDDPRHVPPLPIFTDNPMIDNIKASYNGIISTGSWLFDTGATISLISVAQGMALGLVDAQGEPLVAPDFLVPIGGIGGTVNIPGYRIDNLTIPTLCGYDLVFDNARVGVHDVGIYDPATDSFIILEGVFGSNFLCATVEMATFNISGTAFEKIVIDMQTGTLGLDVNDIYTVAPCCGLDYPYPTGDLDRNCRVNWSDFAAFASQWLQSPCTEPLWCSGADLDHSGSVDWGDFAIFANHWLECTGPQCN